MTTERVLGRWQLDSWEIVMPDGSSRHPLGAAPRGQLAYGEDGRMSVFFMAEGRGSIQFQRGSLEEKAAAYDSFAAYCGTYEVTQEGIIHHIELSSIPALTGSDVFRTFEMVDDSLRIGHEFQTPDGTARGTLAFHRP